ncbi:universal stress protein [Thalassospira lucentensis]|jgi:nucleotide-binding universal stress UspA family protein|uniref:Universal stress protein n=2 Tax=Thalassospira TaxID=168934 RepID=A0A154LAR4_9PROT|nr:MULTISPECIES: universal stress protein [Thalassospira]KZB68295.1 universal stress protein [Thalassospira lucentensis]MAZ35466.1 universal stress protein [Thalassospira sp.]MBO9509065.1 universal stress protein [Thalassospira sp. A3_1]MCH2274457.1 universal stress protein [Thalassospira sp.]RCK33312.1 universal stress protein [Thalassospira xiamenensis]
MNSFDADRELRAATTDRTFLVVVDDSDEMTKALRYACRRAQHTGGRVALLSVIQPAEFQHWMAVGDLMQEEAREDAENRINELAAYVHEQTGSMPLLFIREGRLKDELLKVLDEEEQISILVLAAGTNSDGPGPLITALTNRDVVGQLRLPLTIVPAALSEADIDALS